MIGLNEAFPDGPATDESIATTTLATDRIFHPGGLLQSRMGLEHRPQQEEMARRTLAAWQADRALFFEAGTGVGKSLSYLIPGLMLAVAAKRPLVVSTHTIALQEQIEKKDLALCRRLFEADPDLQAFAGFRSTVLVGKGNYLCGTRLKQALAMGTELFESPQQKELQRIADWARESTTGLRQELSPEPLPEVWDWVQADAHACNPRNCTAKTCFFRKAREAIRQSDLIIVNHSLLFALLAAGHFPHGEVPGILFPEDFMVLDEAHTLPAIATDYFGLRISGTGLRRQLLKLHNPAGRRGRGLLARHGDPGLRKQVAEVAELSSRFFEHLHETYLLSGRPFRLQTPAWEDNPLDVPLRDLIHGLGKLENRMLEGPERDEMEGLRRSLQGYREGLGEAITLADPEAVYWLEVTGKSADRVHLRSAPLDISGPLRQRLFDRRTGLLLTSATLAEGPDMASFKSKVGAPEAESLQVDSPFDYELQMEILIHRRAPGPDGEERRLDTAFLAREILRLTSEVEGGTLALFTSYRDLLAVEKQVRPGCRYQDRPLLFQGSGTSRSDLLKQFKASGRALLLGTESFWTGVDVPGPALSQVIMTRLPFENPGHPVAEARSEKCRQRGGHPFVEITLPAALVKFRQGLGRLIRNQTDEGRLVILDSRILEKEYGRLFLEVLPHRNIRRID